MCEKNRSHHCIKAVAKLALLSVSYVALAAAGISNARAQVTPPAEQSTTQSDESPSSSSPSTPAQNAPSASPPSPGAPAQETTQPGASSSPAAPAQQQSTAPALPAVTVEAPRRRPPSPPTTQTAQVSTPLPSPPQPTSPQSGTTDPNAAIQAAWPASGSQDARTGTVGIYSNSTAVATKINTPLINIPQSVSVITREFIDDTSFQNLTDITRYVPGVAVHQGEGNRDELIIRGVDSSANFYVNGFRDDVQYFRDLYNAQSVEVLKGPSAITFGRASGGGLVNRTLKEADGQRIYEATAQTGSYSDRRFTVDAGQAVNENVAARFNAMYEGSDTFRQFGSLERVGVNPTATVKVDDATKVRFSYEYFHDERTADRGNPSQGRSSVAPSSTSLYPAFPFAPNGDLTAFYGSPTLNIARATVNTTMVFVDHDFENGLTARNGTYLADFKKFYQNVYPGNGPLSGAVNPTDTLFNRAAYNHMTNRQNTFNDTDFFYKGFTGPVFHTIAFGTELGRQAGIDVRKTGIFPNGTNTEADNPFQPTYLGPINFVHQYPGFFSPGVTTADSNSQYQLDLQSAYARDTIEITRFLQLIAAVRVDRFDETALDLNTKTSRNRVDKLVSPADAVIFKPTDNLSIYYAYSVSYLPSSGDQFSAFTDGSVILAPQGFFQKEVGVKWNPLPQLIYSAAAYDLIRTNVPLPDPNNPGFFILSGENRIRGFETELRGYVNDRWQSWLGYAYTDARVSSDTSATIRAGNRIQLVPFHQFSWWNKYQIDPVWSASLGAVYFSDSYASSDDTVYLPGFLRFDAGVYAQIDAIWKAQLTIENIFNKGYWATADGNNNISPGQPRTFRFKVTAKL
jgi:catecholate siderophore receptor